MEEEVGEDAPPSRPIVRRRPAPRRRRKRHLARRLRPGPRPRARCPPSPSGRAMPPHPSVYPLRAASREANSSRGTSPGERTSRNAPLRSSLAFVALRGGRPRRDQRFEGWSAGARLARAPHLCDHERIRSEWRARPPSRVARPTSSPCLVRFMATPARAGELEEIGAKGRGASTHSGGGPGGDRSPPAEVGRSSCGRQGRRRPRARHGRRRVGDGRGRNVVAVVAPGGPSWGGLGPQRASAQRGRCRRRRALPEAARVDIRR